MDEKKHEKLCQHIADELGYPDAIIFEGYEDAFLGMSHDGRAIYSYDRMIEYLIEHDGMSYTDAIEWIDFNTIRAIPYFGSNAPIVLYDDPDWDWYKDEEENETSNENTDKQ